jgi:hypothetical protein
VWRSGATFDPWADGRTAIKASYSRYGLQVGIDRVTNENPLTNGFQLCTWTDPNGDGIAQASEIQTAACGGFAQLNVRYPDANGFDWPYSDEVTAGVERQLARDMRVGVMYYHRTNRKQIGLRNLAAPPSAYTPFQFTVPNGPGGTRTNPKPTTVTVYNLRPEFNGKQNNVIDNQSYLDTDYDGVELTAQKRLSHNWQMTAGLTIGKNEGGLNSPVVGDRGQSLGNGNDLNDPNFTLYNRGIVGNDSKVAFRLSGIYHAPWDIIAAGSLVANGGYPFISTYSVSRADAAKAGVALTRGSQTVVLSARGDERLETVALVDFRLSRAFRFPGGRRIEPQLDIFNLTNSAVADANVGGVGSTYLYPSSIVSPRIMKIGLTVSF